MFAWSSVYRSRNTSPSFPNGVLRSDQASIYRPDEIYVGIAKGGPEDGNELRSPYLTVFIKKYLAPIPYNDALNQDPTDLRARIEENNKAKMTPHRYDFDVDNQVWEYVEYTPAELSESTFWKDA